jgi:hypothetical protein
VTLANLLNYPFPNDGANGFALLYPPGFFFNSTPPDYTTYKGGIDVAINLANNDLECGAIGFGGTGECTVEEWRPGASTPSFIGYFNGDGLGNNCMVNGWTMSPVSTPPPNVNGGNPIQYIGWQLEQGTIVSPTTIQLTYFIGRFTLSVTETGFDITLSLVSQGQIKYGQVMGYGRAALGYLLWRHRPDARRLVSGHRQCIHVGDELTRFKPAA